MNVRPVLLAVLASAGCIRVTEREPAALPIARIEPMKNSVSPVPSSQRPLAYPVTRREPVRDRLFGVEVADPYRWLEDAGAPEVQAWMSAQDELAQAETAALPRRAGIAARLRGLLYVEKVGVPIRRGSRYFYERRPANSDKASVYWREGRDGAEQVLLDPATWSSDGSVALGRWTPSWDGRWVAFGEKRNNSDEATLQLLEVATGKRSAVDVIPGSKYAAPSWTPGGDAFYYTWLPTDPTIPVDQRPGRAELRRHVIGVDPAQDEIIVPANNDPTAFVGGFVSRDGRWLLYGIWHGWRSVDLRFRDLTKAGSPWVDLAVGIDAQFEVEAHDGAFYVKTNEGAPRGRVFRVNPDIPAREHWVEIIPERENVILDSFLVAGGRLLVRGMKNASSLLEVRELDGRMVREVVLPDLGTVETVEGDAGSDDAFFSFTSFSYPTEVRALSMRDAGTSLWFRPTVPVDPARHQVEQVFFNSKDGTRVSMFLVHRKGVARDPETPVLLGGYGGFQVSITPEFSSRVVAWLEQGGMYAVPNLRGGGEYGKNWHRDGMLDKKQNVFDDFVAATEYLIGEGWSRAGRIAILGGSNGGLLVGAAMTQRPELYGAVLCGVPLLDMVRYHLFGSGRTWVSEYGSAESEAMFHTLHAYSPYHHVNPDVGYPPTLLMSADSDDRVDPMHARKFAAILQAQPKGGPALLLIERNAGHGGADLVRVTVERISAELAFALAHTGGARPSAAVPGGPSRR